MTIVAAAIRDGKCSVTTDSRGSNSDGSGRHVGHKFLNIEHEGLIIAFAGSYKVAQIAEDVILLLDPFKSSIDYWIVKRVADAILSRCLTWGVTPSPEETPSFDTSFIFASTDKIYVISTDFAVFEFDDYACIGLETEGNLVMDVVYGDKRLNLTTVTDIVVQKLCKFYAGQCSIPAHTRTL